MLLLMLGVGCAEECSITGDATAPVLCWDEGAIAMLAIEDFMPDEDGGIPYWKIEDPECTDTITSPVTVGAPPDVAEEPISAVLPLDPGEYSVERYRAGSDGLTRPCSFDGSLDLTFAGSTAFTVNADGSICSGGGC